MTKVVVVESPSKAKTINKYLGKDYKVLASFGHVRDLPSKDGSVDPENDFAMNYVVPAASTKHLKEIENAVKGAEALYLATDPDREGEAISWHILEELKRRKALAGVTVHRVEFNEITKTAVTHAIANPRHILEPLVNAQQARRALDYLVGFNLSPLLWRKVRPGLSAGRVQSVALRMICAREAEISAFVAEEYWTMDADFTTPDGKTLSARLHTLGGEKVGKFTINSQQLAESATNALKHNPWHVDAVEKKQTRRHASPPFTTSTLQQEASRKLGFSTRKTMTVAQRLYEGVDLGGETVGLITYMRTDSVNLSNEAITGAREVIARQFGPDYLPETPNFYKTKAKNAQEAHEAVRPTDFSRLPAMLKDKIENDMWRLYDLVWKRATACQMASAKIDQTGVNIVDGKNNVFRATGSVIAFPGFIKAYREGLDDGATDELDDGILPAVDQGDTLQQAVLKPEQHFTEPPPRYTDATLVKSLEEQGIGRPSTYASIISVLQDRGYVRQESRRFVPEDVGLVVNKFLTEHFSRYVDYGFTANMEDQLDAISRGEQEWRPMLHDFWSPFHNLIEEKTTSVRKSDVTSEHTGEKCPTCGEGELLIRLGKYGRFKGCSRYPECKHIEPLEKKEPSAEQAAPVGTGVQCPECHKGEIVRKTSRRGKIFYSCNRYPECKYAIWDKPEATPCPKCQWPLITIKETKRYGTIKKCPHCDWQDPPAAAKPATKSAPAKAKSTTSRAKKPAKATRRTATKA